MRRGDQDPDKVYYRSDSRVFRMNGEWFFASREGDQGPYVTECEAGMELERHVAASMVLSPLKAKVVKEDAMDIPDIEDAPVVSITYTLPKDIDDDPYLTDISQINNSSLRKFRERVG